MTTMTIDAAAPDEGAAAPVEEAPQPKRLEWRGLTLTLPAHPRTMAITAAFRRLARAAENEDGQATMGYLIDMVEAVLGGNEALSDKVWDKIDADGDDEFEAVFDLIEKAAASYEVDLGKSAASPSP